MSEYVGINHSVGAIARLTLRGRRRGPLFPMISIKPGDRVGFILSEELEAHGVNCELIESIVKEVEANPAVLGRFVMVVD